MHEQESCQSHTQAFPPQCLSLALILQATSAGVDLRLESRLPTYIHQAGGSWKPHSTNPVQNNQPPVYSGQIQCMLVPLVTTTDRLHCTTRGCLWQPVKGVQLGLPGIVGTVTINENGRLDSTWVLTRLINSHCKLEQLRIVYSDT